MKDKVTHKKQFKDFKIYINHTLHFHFVLENYVGLQSWTDGRAANRYYIEFYFTDTEIILEYDSQEIWKKVLTIIDSEF